MKGTRRRFGRAMLAVAVFSVLVPALPAGASQSFEDVEFGSTFHLDIEALASSGITKGCNPPDNTEFCPGDPVTRGQMAAFLVRALGLTDGSGGGFSDTVGNTFEADIDRLATAGITKGCNPPDNTRFCPSERVTRAQMAAFLVRALNLADSPLVSARLDAGDWVATYTVIESVNAGGGVGSSFDEEWVVVYGCGSGLCDGTLEQYEPGALTGTAVDMSVAAATGLHTATVEGPGDCVSSTGAVVAPGGYDTTVIWEFWATAASGGLADTIGGRAVLDGMATAAARDLGCVPTAQLVWDIVGVPLS